MSTNVTKSTVSFDVDPLHHGELLEFIASFRLEERSEAIIATLYVGMQAEHSPSEGNSEQLDEIKQEVAVVHESVNDLNGVINNLYKMIEDMKNNGIAYVSDNSDNNDNEKTYVVDDEVKNNLDKHFEE